jgi:ankyrin repeat protein
MKLYDDTRTRPGVLYPPTPLAHYAYEKYDPDMFQLLVKNGMNINAKDYLGDTVLILAVQKANPATVGIVENLLALGADPLSMSKYGAVLDYARTNRCGETRKQVIDLLLQAMPDAKQEFNAGALPSRKKENGALKWIKSKMGKAL